MKYAIRRSKKNHIKVNKHFSEMNNRKYFSNGTGVDGDENFYNHDFLVFPHINKSTFVSREIPSGYIEVSLEQFINKDKIIAYEIY